MHKPHLSFWQIWNMSAIYEYLGARPDQIAKLWIAAPLTGLLVQPIIGAMRDRTWCRLGRRHPCFSTGAILSLLALVAMPTPVPSEWRLGLGFSTRRMTSAWSLSAAALCFD